MPRSRSRVEAGVESLIRDIQKTDPQQQDEDTLNRKREESIRAAVAILKESDSPYFATL